MNLSSNIWKYYILKTFAKQAIVPILVIYFLSNNVSIGQISILISVSTIIGLFFEIPSGYLSDKMGHKNSLALAFGLQFLAMVAYTLGGNFVTFLFASSLYAVGVSFFSGTDSAFLFETLKSLSKESEYEKTEGKATSISQPVSALFLVVTPFLYIVNHLWPFYLNSLMLLFAFFTCLTLTNPQAFKSVKETEGLGNLIKDFSQLKQFLISNKRFTAINIFIAVGTGINDALDEFNQIYLQAIKLPQQFFGFVYATNRLFQGIGGLFSGKITTMLKPLKSSAFFIFYLSLYSLIISFLQNIFIAFIIPFKNLLEGFIVPIQKGQLNKEISSENRITLLSLNSFISRLVEALMVLVLGALFNYFSVFKGLVFVGIGTFIILTPLYLWVRKEFKNEIG